MSLRRQPETQASPTRGLHPLHQILIALDATPHSEMVIENLHRFVRPEGGSCDLLYVLPPTPRPHGKFASLDEEVVIETERIVNEQFDRYTETLSEHHLAVNHRYFIRSEENIESNLLAQLENDTPDLLVLGMHQYGHGGRQIGSTSYAVATHSPAPVLVFKQPPRHAQTLKVLVATDGSSYAMNAAQKLTAFLPPEHTEISLLNVTSLNVYSMPIVEPFVDYAPLEKALRGAAQAILAHTAQIFEEAGYTVSQQLFLLGDPVDQILTEAQNQQADLIVVGSHGTGDKLRKWLLGSVSSKVLEYSPVSVAILK